jgi:hypothetical protein
MKVYENRMQVALDSMRVLGVINMSNFTTNREFHLGLRGELAAPDSAPYPALELAFVKMKNYADSSILYTNSVVKSLGLSMQQMEDLPLKKQGVISESMTAAIYKVHIPKMQIYLDTSNVYSVFYSNTCDQNSIVRRDQWQMVELIGLQLVKWQDSLEMQGKIIAESKGLLRQKFPEQKGEVFFSKYKYVSKLEAAHKLYQQDILQLENTLSRMESANGEEYFYSGPYIRPRMEMNALDQLLGQLALGMQSFREQQNLFISAMAN